MTPTVGSIGWVGRRSGFSHSGADATVANQPPVVGHIRALERPLARDDPSREAILHRLADRGDDLRFGRRVPGVRGEPRPIDRIGGGFAAAGPIGRGGRLDDQPAGNQAGMRVGRAENHLVDTPLGLGFGDHLGRRKDDRIHRDNRQRKSFHLEDEHACVERIPQAERLAEDVDRTVLGRSDLDLRGSGREQGRIGLAAALSPEPKTPASRRGTRSARFGHWSLVLLRCDRAAVSRFRAPQSCAAVTVPYCRDSSSNASRNLASDSGSFPCAA